MLMCTVLLMSYAISVPSITGSPVIPAQIYNVYQQNGYANPSGNIPNDITTYLQGVMAQNQSPPTNVSPSSIKQILFNKILSNPSVQTILNPNSMGYSSDLREFSNNKISPNQIRNFVAPVESLDNNINKNNANLEDEIKDARTEKKSKQTKRRKSSKNKRKHDNAENNQSNSSRKVKPNDINPQNVENTRGRNKKSRKRSHKHSTETSTPIDETKSKENASTKNKPKRQHKEDDKENTRPVEEENKFENKKPRRRHRKQKKNKDDLSKVASKNHTTTGVSKEIKEGINVAHLNEGVAEENRVARNSIQEVNDIIKSLPNKPETIANNYLKGMPHFENNPMLNSFFANYDNIYQSMMKNRMDNTDKRENVKRNPTRNRNNQKRRIENKNKNSTKEVTIVKSNQKVEPEIRIATTEKTMNLSEKIQPNIDLHSKLEVIETFDKNLETEEATTIATSKKDFDNSHDKNLPQESAENTEYVYEGYIDDYYPLFTDSAAYANNREFYIRDIGDNKYFYATDKTNTDFNRLKSEIRRIPDHFTKGDKINDLDYIPEKEESEAFKDDPETEEEVIQFRTPPQLELPDFQTRQVGKSEIKPEPYYRPDKSENSVHRFVGDKSFTETKSPYYTSHQNDIRPETKEKSHSVETVFARSKVVKYGAVRSSEEDTFLVGNNNSSSQIDNNWKDDSSFKDRGTTYVIATSLGDY